MSGRRTLALILAAAILLVPGTPAAGVKPASQAISVKVDYENRVITITVRMDFWVKTGEQGTAPLPEGIAQAIEKTWNGHRYKCFEVVVDVVARSVDGEGDVGGDAVGVELVVGPYIRSHQGPEKGTWWAGSDPGTWAHEFGHVLGLDNTYVEGTWQLQGSKDADIMWNSSAPVRDGTVEQAVQAINPQIDESKMRCDLKVDYTAKGGEKFYGKKCDRPEGQWAIDVSGGTPELTLSGTITFRLDRTLEGDFEAFVTGKGNVGGVAAFGVTARWDGIVNYAGDQSGGNLVFRGAAKGGIEFGAAFIGGGGKGGFTLPVQAGMYCKKT